jgi:hypothetical protein
MDVDTNTSELMTACHEVLQQPRRSSTQIIEDSKYVWFSGVTAAAHEGDIALEIRQGVIHRRDQIAMASRLDAQHAEAVLRIVEGDPLDEAGKHFRFGFRLLPHASSANWYSCRLSAPRP